MSSSADDDWQRYALALLRSMAEVLEEVPEEAHASLLEAADYWLSIGLVIGIGRSADANRLLELIETHDVQRSDLERDAAALCREILE